MRGGQKLVFPCRISGQRCVLKFMLPNPSPTRDEEEDQTFDSTDEVTARARREVSIMGQCDSPYLVKLGPVPLTRTDYGAQSLIYFAEEFIEGEDLKAILGRQRVLTIRELVRLARNVTEAVRVLWQVRKIHRDIKPSNIMRRDATAEFVLLDMGMAFDLGDESYTPTGLVPGTPIYFSPEQTEFARKRQMDFRSDLFSLGIVLYEAACGIHPFRPPGVMSTYEVIANILTYHPPPPGQYRRDMSPELGATISRLLAKRPHLRYRSCESLDGVLSEIEAKLTGA